MEFLSMPHSRTATSHLSPKVGDTLVSNLRAPLLTVVEDTSPGVHDTLIAACDPQRYKQLGVEKWAEHGSCAENLVLALQELNKKIGLKGRRAIGADVTVNNVPAPLNLFMNIPISDDGAVTFEQPNGKRGAYIKFRAERDCVIVMSACPQDVLPINGGKPMVAHFVVDTPSDADRKAADEKDEEAKRIIEKARLRTEKDNSGRKKPPAIKRGSSAGTNAGVSKPSISRARSSQASVQAGAPRPAPRKLGSSSASIRRQSSAQAVQQSFSTPQQARRPPPVQRLSSQQQPTATKETQQQVSDPPKPRPRPSVQGAQTGQSEQRNVAKPGKAKPKKLERRSAA